tara:strand:+ start:250 stop:450 length:201 start_codon:yes stop_codon:yes gene_type:complete
MKRIIWQCTHCDDVVISYSHLRHEMNWCDCGKTAMDLEEGYRKEVGEPKVISVKEQGESGFWERVK